jgi:HD domain
MPTVDTLCEAGPLIRRFKNRLVREQPEVPRSVLDECVRDAWSRFEDARVQAFVPVLVERAVRDRIGRLAAADAMPLDEVSLWTWSWLTARRLLAEELPRRWAHARGVARQAEQIAPAFPRQEAEVLVASAWLHDIGYASALTVTGLHQLDGARFLVACGVPFRVCALVAHHAGAAAVADLVGLADELSMFEDERGPVRDALWYCDMTTGPDGRRMTFDERMAELSERRSADDPVVRALAVNGAERAAAVRRTEERLHRLAPSGGVIHW